MRKVGLIFGLALVGFACTDGARQAGSAVAEARNAIQEAAVPTATAQAAPVPPAKTKDKKVSCNKSARYRMSPALDFKVEQRWAEFEVEPGVTEVTVCQPADPNPFPLNDRASCTRSKASWWRGTTTGFVPCGSRVLGEDEMEPDPISITVHR